MSSIPETTAIVNQRYVANSCTLEITAAQSLLSRWSQQPILKQARFRLWFQQLDDQATPQLVAQGNQTQLESLNMALNDYIQRHLSQSTGTQSPGALRWPLGQHRLVVATQPLTLTTLELFDLAEALDQYEQQGWLAPMTITAVKQRRPYVGWSGSVAAAMLLVVGGMIGLRQYYLGSALTVVSQREPAQTAPLKEEASRAAPESLDQQIPETSPSASGANGDNPASGVPRDSTPEAGSSDQAADESGKIAQTAPTDNGVTSELPSAKFGGPGPNLTRPRAPTISGANAPEAAIAPPPRQTSPRPAIDRSTSAERGDNSEALTTTNEAAPRSAPSLPEATARTPGDPESSDAAGTANGANSAYSTGRAVPPPQSPAADSMPTGSVSATTLSEVSAYFDRQWSGGEGATALVYELQLNSNGMVTALKPLNEAAVNYGWRVPGGAIASPFSVPTVLLLEVVLYPDGRVAVRQK